MMKILSRILWVLFAAFVFWSMQHVWGLLIFFFIMAWVIRENRIEAKENPWRRPGDDEGSGP